jgi:hypothetical protein
LTVAEARTEVENAPFDTLRCIVTVRYRDWTMLLAPCGFQARDDIEELSADRGEAIIASEDVEG